MIGGHKKRVVAALCERRSPLRVRSAVTDRRYRKAALVGVVEVLITGRDAAMFFAWPLYAPRPEAQACYREAMPNISTGMHFVVR